MGLDLQRLDLGALAAAAGNSIGRLGLDVADWGAYGRNYAATQAEQQKIATIYAQMENQKQLQAMQQQGSMEELAQRGQQSLGLAQQQNTFQGGQNELDRAQQLKQMQMQQAIRQQELEQQNKYQQGQLGIAQGNLDLNRDQLGVDASYKEGMLKQQEAEMMQDKYFKTFEVMKTMDEKEVEKLASYGGIVSVLAKHDPKAISGVLDYGAAKGFFSSEIAEQLKQLPPDQIHNTGLMFASAGGHALEWMKMSYDNNKKTDAGSISIKENPDGTREISIGAENKVKAEAQQSIATSLKNAESLSQIVKSFNPKYLTMSGKLQSAAGEALSYFDLGDKSEDFIKQTTGQDPKLLKQYAADYKKFTSQVATFKMEFIKAMSGLSYTDKQMTAMEDAIMTEKDSPASFYGKAQGLSVMINTNLKSAQAVVDAGIPQGTPEFQKAFEDKLQDNVVKELEAKSLPGLMIDGEWLTGQEINDFAKAAKLSVREVLKRKGAFL